MDSEENTQQFIDRLNYGEFDEKIAVILGYV